MPKILVADDSIAVRKVAERLLTEAGLGVTLAANGEEALAYLSKERPDVIVSDVIMPDKSGYEVCAFVRGNSMLAETPVLLISGIVNDEVTKQAESCRADGVLKKPFQGTSLKDRVLELLAKRQKQTPAPAPKTAPAQAAVATHAADKDLRISDEQLGTNRQASINLKEVEDQLRAERTRTADLAKRMVDLEGQVARAKESEALLAVERRRVTDLSSKVAKIEQEAAGWQKASGRVAELEAALHAERAAAAQLVQQLTDLEQVTSRAKDVEAKLAREEQRASEFQQRAKDVETILAVERAKVGELSNKVAAAERMAQRARELEVMLMAEQQKGAVIARRLHDLENFEMKLQEMEALLATERDRNGLLARRVSETEQAAENATKRFEDMARKLGEIAGLASQLGNGKGQS
ncbi:MAG: response regulator [Nitrospira sp.]|nr:MAG: response regulator [Nitrospira sp.]